MELEQLLRTAEVLKEEEARSGSRVAIGRTVALENLSNGNKVQYKLVSPSEAKISEGKISIASPVGEGGTGEVGWGRGGRGCAGGGDAVQDSTDRVLRGRGASLTREAEIWRKLDNGSHNS